MSEDLPWRTINTETAYSCAGFAVETDLVTLPDGDRTSFDSVAVGESVVVLPLLADGEDATGGATEGDADASPSSPEVVVIEEWRQAVDRVSRGLPAGDLEEEDADLASAARRELREETGYVADDVTHLTSVEPANGFADAVYHYFLATDCSPEAEQDLDDNESIRVDTAAFDDLLEDVRTGALRDGRSATAITYYALFGHGSERPAAGTPTPERPDPAD